MYSHPFGGLTGYLAFDIQLAPNTTSFQAPSATWPSPSSRHGLYFLLKALQLFCYAPKLLIPRQEGRHDKRHLTAYICVVKNLINQLGLSRRMRRRRIHGWRILRAARRCFLSKLSRQDAYRSLSLPDTSCSSLPVRVDTLLEDCK